MKYITLVLVLVGFSPQSWAWGKRGHQIVGETAALVVSSEPGLGFMRTISFDFGYYANVPDFIWKRPATYESEKPEHFMDLEIFDRAFKDKVDLGKPFELSRKDFEARFPEVKPKAGRAYWRVQEMVTALEQASEKLRALPAETMGKPRQDLQEKWLLLAGPLAHYVGDLAMPLHVSENYDGQMTGQKGLHHYFEESMVDMLYPDVLGKVNAAAEREWPKFKKNADGKSTLQLVQAQTERSHKAVNELLKLDKGRKREPASKKEAKRYEAMIIRQLTDASLTLAELYRRNLGWKFDGHRFYFFAGEPAHIKPGPIE